MLKTINSFIVNMAMSDPLFSVFILRSHLAEWFWAFIGHLGKVQIFLQYISCLLSVESLVLIAFDRFVAVVLPLRAPLFNSKLCIFVILVTWLVRTALSFPVFFAYNPVEHTTKLRCEWLWKDSLASFHSHIMPMVF